MTRCIERRGTGSAIRLQDKTQEAQPVDVLLVHVPRMRRHMNQIMVMPAGLFSLADTLDQAGIRTRILHVGLRRQADPQFSLADYVRECGARLVGFTLHWFYQTYDVIQAINQVKAAMPHLPVVVGGYTASCLYKELIGRRSVDFVVRGDGELPLQQLARHVLGHGDGPLASIPNLVWRDSNGVPRANELSYQATAEFMQRVSHARPDLLEDAATYFSDAVFYKDFDERIRANRADFFRNVFYYTPGKGCPYNCSFCGGSHATQTGIFSRPKVWFFSHEKILCDLRELHKAGIRTLRISFDPDPKRTEYLRLFQSLREEGLSFTLVFDCWTPPTSEFTQAVGWTFGPESMLVISPDAGSEEVRRKNKSCFYTNQELLVSLQHLKSYGVRGHVFFGVGLPFESAPDLEETRQLALEVARQGVHVSALPMDCDPCSMIQQSPEFYGVSLPGQGLRFYFESTRSDEPFVSYTGSLLSPADISAFVESLIGELNGLS